MRNNNLLFKILVAVSLMVWLGGCNPTDWIAVGCSATDLIHAINQANSGPDHDALILVAGCDYILTDVDNLTGPYGFDAGEYGANGLPVITSEITIEGNGARILRSDAPGTPEFRFFYIGDQGVLTLNDVTLENGLVMTASDRNDGGAIYNTSILVLNGSSMKNSQVSILGGAILNRSDGWVTIHNSTFENNSAPYAGAIYNYGVLFVGTNTLFQNNSAEHYGGALIAGCSSTTIQDTSFINNHSDYHGGAFECNCMPTQSHTITFDRVAFEGNTAPLGGAIKTTNWCEITISDSAFTANQASNGGGAIYNQGITTVDMGTLFTANIAEYNGGAVYNVGDYFSLGDSAYRENYATLAGGAIYDRGNLTINTGLFELNQAGGNGGAIYCLGDLAPLTEIYGATFKENTAISGGAIHINWNCEFSIAASTFRDNTAGAEYGGFGGAVQNLGTGVISDQTNMFGNTAYMGGAIDNYGTLDLTDVILYYNEAFYQGGAVINSSDMTIANSTIKLNGSFRGAGVYNVGTMEIFNSTFNNNEASDFAGAIYSDDYLRLTNSTVSTNFAERCGGVCITGGTATIEFCTVVYNTTVNLLEGSNRFQGSADIKNSIFALNTLDCLLSAPGSINALGVNLHSDGTCPGFTIKADPLVGPLANTGGPTQTRSLLPGSPAIDAVLDCTFVDSSPTLLDQRGQSRPQGTRCDIGAVEFTTFPIPPLPEITATPSWYSCLGILGISFLDGDRMRIQLETPGLPDGAYAAKVGEYDFICKTYPEYPDRLFCDGPKGEGGTTATLIVYDPLGLPFCEQTFTIPSREGDGDDTGPKDPSPTPCPPGIPSC